MHTRYILTLCTALVVGGALLTGSTHALGQADEKTPINDTWLTAKTKIALAADGRVRGSLPSIGYGVRSFLRCR
jgi:hypothetical protein